MQYYLTDEAREEIAEILEKLVEEGLPGPRDLAVALDAIQAAIDLQVISLA
jgi:hypothetical protein